jgi:predicted  nucleic acid-binding Zn-ribbon protein
MGELIEALHRLQEVELQLARIRGVEEAKTRRINTQKRQLKKTEDKLGEIHAALTERQKQIDSTSLEASSREETINKHREALSRAKTNKEYAAILLALNTEKASSAKVESEVLELMDRNYELQREQKDIEEQRAQALGRIASAEQDLRDSLAQVENERGLLQAQREDCAENIPASALSTFARVAERHDGEALVPVSKIHPKREEYACSGCHMTITLEVISTLRSRDEVQFCKVCGRILYLEEAPAKSS